MCMINEMKNRLQAIESENKALKAQVAHITEQATHAARCQLIREIEELFRAGEPMTAAQVLDLLSAEKETAA